MALDKISTPNQRWEDVAHLAGRDLRIYMSDGSIKDYWQLDTENKDLWPLKNSHGKIVGYKVWLWAYMNCEYPRELKMRSISELLELNP